MGCCGSYRSAWPSRFYYMPYPVITPNYPAANPSVFMRGKAIDVWFTGVLFERHIEGLVFQYDKGLELNVKGLDTSLVNEIQFARVGDNAGVTVVTPTVVDPSEDEDEDTPVTSEDTVDFTVEDSELNATSTTVTLRYYDAMGNLVTQTVTTDTTEPEQPYLSAAIPDALLEEPGKVVAYLVYNKDGEYRTVKAVYIHVQPREAITAAEDSTTGCGCDDKIAELEATIAELAAKVEELTNNAGG